jgi:hypothetical protein
MRKEKLLLKFIASFCLQRSCYEQATRGKWCRQFEAGKSDVHDGRPSVVTDEIIQKIYETIDKLHQQCPEVSRTVLHG